MVLFRIRLVRLPHTRTTRETHQFERVQLTGLTPKSKVTRSPIVEPLVEPIVEPMVEPMVEPIVEPMVEPIVEPIVVEPGNRDP